MNHTESPVTPERITTGLSSKNKSNGMPDVALEKKPEVTGQLARVGMSDIELMVRMPDADGMTMRLPAMANAYVSLDDNATKGIHMSRLYLALNNRLHQQDFTPATLREVCNDFLQSHTGISRQAEVNVRFSLPTWRPALLSDHSAPRHYNVAAKWIREDSDKGTRERLFVEVQVVYSSTCPCSAALSRQLLQQKFQNDFAFHRWVSVSNVEHWLGEHGSLATPHSQRSVATIQLEMDHEDMDGFPFESIIDEIEGTLKTAVQSVVKRQDEQEFARLNGSNQMFCEDAARRMKSVLDRLPLVLDYRVEARHMESLHPHDATAVAVKGIPDGMKA